MNRSNNNFQSNNEIKNDGESLKMRCSATQQKDLQNDIDTSRCGNFVRETNRDCTLDSDMLQKQSEIRSFEKVLHSDPLFLSELNASVQNKFPSIFEFMATLQSQPGFDRTEFIEELAYTSNTLYTPRGVKITNTDQIVRFVKMENSAQATQHNFFYKAASKAIFASLTESLTSLDGLIRPQLCATASIKDCSFEINLKKDKPHVVAECFVNISVPGGACGRLDMTGELDISRIDVAGVIVEVYFCPREEVLSVEILHLSPSEKMSDQQVLAFAKSATQ
jgi:hypothetical protein